MNSVDSYIRPNSNEASNVSCTHTDSNTFWLTLMIFREVVHEMEYY